MTIWSPSDTPDFSISELRCRCGCGRADMEADFMSMLQALRDTLGPLPVSSGFRCPVHNDQVSATGLGGPHTTGKAADLRVYGARAYRLLGCALAVGFTGIGVKQNGPRESRFVHLDTLDADATGGLRPWLWSY